MGIEIDIIRPYLENGYELLISKSRFTDKSNGILIYIQNNEIRDIKYLMMDEFMNIVPNIKRNINDYRWCRVKYDIHKGKIINSIEKENFSGQYNEERYYMSVDDLEVESDDVLSSFILQEEKVKNYVENNEKIMKKGEI